MLTENEKLFMQYWERRRDIERNVMFQLAKGIPWGLLFAVPIVILLYSSRFWFHRADMEASSRLNPGVLGLAIFLIVVFVAVFYKRHQWEMKEQQYLELKQRASGSHE